MKSAGWVMTSTDKHTATSKQDRSHNWPAQRLSPSLTSADGKLMMTPSPPPHKPSTRRPRTGRRSRLNSAQSTSSDERPLSSALSRYSVLPPIDHLSNSPVPDNTDELVESTRRLSISKKEKTTETPGSAVGSIRIPTGVWEDCQGGGDDTVPLVTGKRKNSVVDVKSYKTQRKLSLNEEPTGPPRLCLKVKLPDGSELKRHFRPTEPLQMVLDFAEFKMGSDLTGYTLVKNAPAKEFTNLSVTLENAGIEDRTLLYLQVPPPD